MKKILFVFALTVSLASGARAGDILWFLGHSGYDEGHTQIEALLNGISGGVDVSNGPLLPVLDQYSLIFIVMPGFFNAGDFFTGPEKDQLNDWLALGSHRVVMVGDWDGFYQGQDVMNDLLAAIGNPIVFDPGAFDSSCGHCNGPMGDPDPLTAGLGHICYAFTPTWDPAFGVPLAYPEDPAAPGPWIVSNGTDIPCIVGIGDQNAITDPCGYVNPGGGDADTKTFVERLYQITCAGEELFACCLPDGSCQVTTEADCGALGGTYFPGLPCNEVECPATPTVESSWGSIKTQFRGETTK
jgi:hypothetical protein